MAPELRYLLHGVISPASASPHEGSSVNCAVHILQWADGATRSMHVLGADEARLGELERVEIDASGAVTHIIARDSGKVSRRIAATYVIGVRRGSMYVSLTADDFAALPEVVSTPPAWAQTEAARSAA
jgi:hypothetical protein